MTRELQFGASSLFLRHLSAAEAVAGIGRVGYRGAEVWISHLWRSGGRAAEVRRTVGDLGLRLTAHATSYDLNITSVNPAIRQVSLEQVRRSLEEAAELGAEVVTVHPGAMSSSRARPEEYWPELEEAVALIDGWAHELGLPVGLELMERRPKEFFMLPADAARLDGRQPGRVGLTVDIAHANSHMDPLRFLNQLDRTRIFHVHLSDNSPQETHLPLGQGKVDVAAVLGWLSGWYRGLVVLEGYGNQGGEELLTANLDYLRRLQTRP